MLSIGCATGLIKAICLGLQIRPKDEQIQPPCRLAELVLRQVSQQHHRFVEPRGRGFANALIC
ncbi:MAG: hypothetical protein CL798_03335 [Chromatiales bacterium]|nr:hypothetical protein [Chromatiales bacterium]